MIDRSIDRPMVGINRPASMSRDVEDESIDR